MVPAGDVVNYIEVRDLSGKVLPGIPTARLMEAGGGEAYFMETTGPMYKAGEGVWYLHEEPTYRSPDGQYTRVRIVRLEDWHVDVRVKPVNDRLDDVEAYDDFFIVRAATEQDAFREAEREAHEDMTRRYGEEYGSDISTIRAYRGSF